MISTKAGYDMWPGPYGEWGSRKYVLGSLEQSLKRMRLDYVDIFYSHRFDPETPLEETMGALDTAVRQGKARYVGISSYSPRRTEEAATILREMGTPLLIHQPSYSMLNRWIEEELLDVLDREGVGAIVFSPLAQGLLTDRYLDGVPEDSRLRIGNYLAEDMVSEENLARVRALNEIAQARGQSLAQMAIAWVLRDPRVTSALLGARSVKQLEQNVAALDRLEFDQSELEEIDRHAVEGGVNLWAASSRGVGATDRTGYAAPGTPRRRRGPYPYCGLLEDVVTIWPLLLTYVCAGAWEMLTVNVPCGGEPSASTALALPFRPAATSQATTWWPGATAVTAQSNLAVWPGPSAPRAQVLA